MLERIARDLNALSTHGTTRFPRLRFALWPWGVNWDLYTDKLLDDNHDPYHVNVAPSVIPPLFGTVGVIIGLTSVPLIGDASDIAIIISIVALMMGLFATNTRLRYIKRCLRGNSNSSTDRTQAVARFLNDRLDNIGDDLLGVASPYTTTVAQVRAVQDQARVLLERALSRLRERVANSAPHLEESVRLNNETVTRTQRTLDHLERFRAKVEAFLTEARSRISPITLQMEDLEIVRASADLHQQAVDVTHRAEREIADLVAGLADHLTVLHDEARTRELLACEIASALPASNDRYADLERLEDVIETFVASRAPEPVKA